MNKYLYNDEITATLSQVTPLYPPYPKGGWSGTNLFFEGSLSEKPNYYDFGKTKQ